jgi:hypothetical protein
MRVGKVGWGVVSQFAEFKCGYCGDTGFITTQVPHYETVTMDMAIDAGDRNLCGEQVQFGFDEIQEPCPNCQVNTNEGEVGRD